MSRRVITLVVAVAVAAALSAGIYFQFLKGPSFEDRYRALTHFDFVVNTRYSLEEIDADPVAEAVEAGHGTVSVIWDGPNASDVMSLITFADVDDADRALAELRDSSNVVDLPPYSAFFDDEDAFCWRDGDAHGCAVRFDDTIVRGDVSEGSDAEAGSGLDGAQTLVQAGSKNLHQLNLDLGG